jgi:thermostable 8-oxoguanine DNA glycosylase
VRYRAFAQYACRIKGVGHQQEVVHDMKEDIMALLKEFRLRNDGVKPEAIVVYRDGVSHGEFKNVRL